MDPNKLLSDLLPWAHQVLHKPDSFGPSTIEAAQMIVDLDSWLTRGGFLPDRWAKTRKRDVDGLQKAIQDTQEALQDLARALGGPK